MNSKILWVAVVVVAIIATGAYLYPKVTQPLGAVPGPDVQDHMYLNGGSTNGGRVATTSTRATYTLVAKDVASLPTYIDWLVNVNTTVSLSATSTFGYVPNIGDVAVIYIRNASTTAGATLTLAAVDSGVDLQDNEDGSTLSIDGLDWGRLTIIREATHLTTVLFDKFIEAD